MSHDTLIFLFLSVVVIAFLYSSVGHAGASGYIAIMSLFNIVPSEIKPAALTLNIIVSVIGSWQFYRTGHFSWKLFWPFALLAVPLAYVGGRMHLPIHIFKMFIGVVLFLSALQLLFRLKENDNPQPPSQWIALCIGVFLGLLSGMIGVGGGIFLTPLLILMNWATTRKAAATSALFILVNSISGLAGTLSSAQKIPSFTVTLAWAVIAGGFFGSYLGSRRLSHVVIKRLLAVVLIIAAYKMIFI